MTANLIKSSLRLSALALCAASFSSQSAVADTFNFYTPTGNLGTSQTYTSGANSITIYGFDCTHNGNDTACLSGNSLAGGVSVHSTDLYGKNGGSTEQGIGIYGDPYHDGEISKYDFIDIDLTNAGATTGNLTISSLQSGESFKFCYGNSNSGWNSNSCSATFVGTGADFTTAFSLGAYHDISLIGVNTDVLLRSLTTTPNAPTPEPESLALLGTGLLGAVGMARRRFKSAKA